MYEPISFNYQAQTGEFQAPQGHYQPGLLGTIGLVGGAEAAIRGGKYMYRGGSAFMRAYDRIYGSAEGTPLERWEQSNEVMQRLLRQRATTRYAMRFRPVQNIVSGLTGGAHDLDENLGEGEQPIFRTDSGRFGYRTGQAYTAFRAGRFVAGSQRTVQAAGTALRAGGGAFRVAASNPYVAGGLAVATTVAAPAYATYGAYRTATGLYDDLGDSYVEGTGGDATDRTGLSRERAAEIASDVTRFGMEDFGYSIREVGDIARGLSEGGMFEGIADMDREAIVKGVKDATSVLKVIADITGDRDIKQGISVLKSLRSAGIGDWGEMSRVLRGVRGKALVSGVSTQELLSGAGNQGALWAAGQGMLGASGLQVATDAYAGFTSAYKAGLLGTKEYKRLGGAQGMTTAYLSGTKDILDTPLARMAMETGVDPSKPMDALQQWSNYYAEDPLAREGDWLLNKERLKEEAVERDPLLALRTLKGVAGMYGRTDKAFIATLGQSMGMDSQELKALFALNQSYIDPRARYLRGDAYRTGMRKDFRERQSDEWRSLEYSPLGAVTEPVRESVEGVGDFLAWTGGGLVQAGGQLLDQASERVTEFLGYTLDKDMPVLVSDQLISLQGKGQDYDDLFGQINKLALSGNEDALQALKKIEAGDTAGAMKNLERVKGIVTGEKAEYKQDLGMQRIRKGLESGSIYAKRQQIKVDKVDDTIKALRVAGAAEGDTDSNLADAIQGRLDEDREGTLKTLGVTERMLEGKSDAEVMDTLVRNSKTAIKVNRGEIKGTSDLYKRLAERGVNVKAATSYLSGAGLTAETWTDANSGWFENETKNVDRLAKEIKQSVPPKDVKGVEMSDIDKANMLSQQLIDMENPEAASSRDNTKAIRGLTESINTLNGKLKAEEPGIVNSLVNRVVGNR